MNYVIIVNNRITYKGIKSIPFVIEKVVLKLGKEYAAVMHRNMKSFKEHVSKAHHNVFIDFIFPMPIEGLTY